MLITDGYNTGAISASSPVFKLGGGRYSITMIAGTWGTSAAFQSLGPDGSTYITAPTLEGGTGNAATLSANGSCVCDLPNGSYRFTLTGSFTNFRGTVSGVNQ